MKCLNKDCGEEVPSYARNCIVCGFDAGFPNVRHAEQKEEVETLDHRVEDVLGKESEAVVIQFGEAVKKSMAVLCRPFGVVQKLVSTDNELYATFYGLINGESRLPENNKYDTGRRSVDSTLFPHYEEHIRFAALSLDGKGLTDYGSCCLVLKDSSIANRATVFEENSFTFCQKFRVVVGEKIPAGYRATWSNRYNLAVAKLGNELTATTSESDFPKYLLGKNSKDGSDFIEVHIFGPIHRRAIDCLIVTKPKNREDRVLLRSIEKKLGEIGVGVEVIL